MDEAQKGRRARPWREDPVILARLPEVERRHLKGEPNTTIAAALSLDEGTIRNDLKRLRELWRERVGATVVDMRARAVADLEEIKRRAIAAVEFDEMAERAVLFNQAGPDGAKVHHDDKGSAMFRGNKAAALAVARGAVMDQAKILGVVVDKVAASDADGQTLNLAELVLLARKGREGRDDSNT